MTWREEQIGDCRLILGDCREVLPTLRHVDTILVDPVWPRCPVQTIQGADRPYELWAETCAVMPSHKRVIVVMRMDCDPRFLCPTPGKFFRVMWLPYVMPGYVGRALGGDESAYWFGEPVATAPGRMVIPGRGPLVQPGFKTPDDHPMKRPQAHFDWLVYWGSDDGETICDPMMGGATTAIAALHQSRSFVGIEIEPKYFDIACRRVEEAYRQGDLIRDVYQKPQQERLAL